VNMPTAEKNIVAFLPALLALAGVLVVSNCGATRPIHYYTLNPEPPPLAAGVNKSDVPVPVSIVVGHISASHLYLNDPIVYNTGGMQMGTYQYHRWAEFPVEMLETMLTQSLLSSGRYRSVAKLGSGVKGDYILRGHLYSLEEIDSPSLAARFSMEIELFQPKTGLVVWSDVYSHDEPVQHKTIAAVVQGLRQNVSVGLNQLTESLNSYLSTVSPQ
jgi:ABC-type uncharacterized transport system auxiliary subunit